ncbi:unnamed protein product [Rhodiola kirilowii]
MENAQLQTPPSPPPPSPRGDKKPYTGNPRGRPRGSKNKLKPPVIINKEHPNALSSHILEISPTHDIVKSMSDFAAKRHRGMCVISASGTVTNVVLRQPPLPHQQNNNSHVMTNSGVVNFTGIFEILSMSGAFFPSPAPPPASGISVQLSGGHGHVVGGKVVEPLVAVSTVVVVVASFATSLYNKLPLSEERGRNNNRENENLTVTVAVPGTGDCGNVPFFVPQMPMMAMNSNPTAAVEGTASSYNAPKSVTFKTASHRPCIP